MALLLPFEQDPNYPLADTSEECGFSKLSDTHGLEKISEEFGKEIKRIAERGGDAGSVTDAAIPSILSYQSYLRQRIMAADSSSQEVLAWRGILAIIGLSNFYSFELGAMPVSGNESAFAENLIKLCRQEEIIGDKVPLWLLTLGGKPVAFFHSKLGFCPFKEMDQDAVKYVPWFDSQKRRWLDVAEVIQTPDLNGGELCEKGALAAWLTLLKKDIASTELLDEIKKWINQLGGTPVNGNYLNPATAKDLGVGNFGDALAAVNIPFNHAAFSMLPSPDNAPPMEMFLETVVARKCIEKCLHIECHGETYFETFDNRGNNVRWEVLLPLSKEMTVFLTDNIQTVRLENVSVKYDGKVLSFSIELKNGNYRLIRNWKYIEGAITFNHNNDNFPWMFLWPYIRLIDGNANNLWNHYIIVEKSRSQESPFTLIPNDKTSKVTSKLNKNIQWNVHKFSKLPLFLCLRDKTGYRGCIYIHPPKPELAIPQYNIRLGVDFGTSNTIIRLKGNANENDAIFPGYTKTIADHNQDSDIAGVDDGSNWMPLEFKSIEGAIMTIAQLFEGNSPTVPVPFVNGIAMYVMNVDRVFTWMKGEPLDSKGIYNNLKLQKNANPEMVAAAKVYLNNLMLYALFNAVRLGASQVDVIISYPRDDILSNIKIYWASVENYVKNLGLCGINSISYSYISEADAASRYFLNLPDVMSQANAYAGFAVVDIGGGTSDISVWQSAGVNQSLQCLGSSSIQYAGRDIMIQSLFGDIKVEKWCIKEKMGEFENLWGGRSQKLWDPVARTLRDEFNDKELQKNPLNFSNPKSSKIAVVLEMLVSRLSFDDNALFSPSRTFGYLKAVVRVKLFLLLNMVAGYICSLPGLERRENFKIYLAGSGSRAMDFFKELPNDDTSKCAEKIFSHIISSVDQSFGEVNVVVGKNAKREVVSGLVLDGGNKSIPSINMNQYSKIPEKIDDDNSSKAKDAYHRLLNRLSVFEDMDMISYFKSDEAEKSFQKQLMLQDSNGNDTDAGKLYKQLFSSVYQKVYTEMPGSRVPADMFYDVLAAFMMDTLINNLISYKEEKN